MCDLLILHIVTDLREKAGGIASVVPALAEALHDKGIENRFVTCAHDSDFAWRAHTALVPTGKARNRAMLNEVISRVITNRSPSTRVVVHSHGLWDMLNHAGVRLARESGFGSLISIHGMLLPWARRHKKFRKDAGWLLYQRRDLLRAGGLHVTSQDEADILAGIVPVERLHAIPFGVALPDEVPSLPTATLGRTLLFLGRLHPVKNLDSLIRAFVRVAPVGYRLRLVGPDEDNHRAALAALIDELGASDRVEMPGPAYGAAKQREIACAHAVVLPSFTENFGAVVTEALAMGRPVIASTGTPWQTLHSECCGWWVAPGVDSLAQAIGALAVIPDAELTAMGARGRAFVIRELRWANVAGRMATLYRSISSSQYPAEAYP